MRANAHDQQHSDECASRASAVRPVDSNGAAPPAPVTLAEVRRFTLLQHEAFVRGFRNALSFRRWCRRHGVPIRRDGKREWVCTGDIDEAVAAFPKRRDVARDDAVAMTVAAVIAKAK